MSKSRLLPEEFPRDSRTRHAPGRRTGGRAVIVRRMDRRWGRLAKAIDEDRQRLRMSWAALAKAARFSDRTLYDLRDGIRTSYAPETLDRLERALHWETGSVERVLGGRAPIRKVDPEMARLEAVWPDLPPNIRRLLADVAQLYRD